VKWLRKLISALREWWRPDPIRRLCWVGNMVCSNTKLTGVIHVTTTEDDDDRHA